MKLKKKSWIFTNISTNFFSYRKHLSKHINSTSISKHRIRTRQIMWLYQLSIMWHNMLRNKWFTHPTRPRPNLKDIVFGWAHAYFVMSSMSHGKRERTSNHPRSKTLNQTLDFFDGGPSLRSWLYDVIYWFQNYALYSCNYIKKIFKAVLFFSGMRSWKSEKYNYFMQQTVYYTNLACVLESNTDQRTIDVVHVFLPIMWLYNLIPMYFNSLRKTSDGQLCFFATHLSCPCVYIKVVWYIHE